MANDDYNSQQARTQQMQAQHARPYQGQQQQYQQQPYQQQYQYQPQVRMVSKDTTTTGQWVLTLFLAAIPVLGFILLLVWSFSSGTARSKKNWARANLVWILIAIIVSVVTVVVAKALGIPVEDYMQQYLNQYRI